MLQDRPLGCNCICHTSPGVKHMVACCDKPPYREEAVVLTVDRFSSKCGACGLGADPYEKCHDTVIGYYAQDVMKPDPCGKKFTHILSFYTDGTDKIDKRLHEMRPDLEVIPTLDIVSK